MSKEYDLLKLELSLVILFKRSFRHCGFIVISKLLHQSFFQLKQHYLSSSFIITHVNPFTPKLLLPYGPYVTFIVSSGEFGFSYMKLIYIS